MIRQIVVEQGDGKPDLVGLLLTSRDLPEAESAKLGERLARCESVRTCESLRGHYKGIRWRWVATDHVTPGLEFHTIVVPRGTAAGASSVVLFKGASVGPGCLTAWGLDDGYPPEDAELVTEAEILYGGGPGIEANDYTRGTPVFEQWARARAEMTAVLGPDLAADIGIGERPCDSLPTWLWVAAALVVIGVLIAVASPAFIAGVF